MSRGLGPVLLLLLLGCPRPTPPVPPPPPAREAALFPTHPGLYVYLVEESRPGAATEKRPWTMEIAEPRAAGDATLVRAVGFVLDLVAGPDPQRRQTILAVRPTGVSLGLETPATLAELRGAAPDPSHLAPELVLPLTALPACAAEPCFSVEATVEPSGARSLLVRREDAAGRTTLTLVAGVGVTRFVHRGADGHEVRGELVDQRPALAPTPTP